MNERIKQLANQAQLQPYYDAQEAAIKLFAQLIVQECAGICDDYGMPDGTSPTAIILSAAIKKRFGVLE